VALAEDLCDLGVLSLAGGGVRTQAVSRLVTIPWYLPYEGPGVASWLRHYATSRKVPGSIPVVSLGILSVASCNSMCPGST
jgi:hypothetical protein